MKKFPLLIMAILAIALTGIALCYGRCDLAVIRYADAHFRATPVESLSTFLSFFGLVGYWIAGSLLLWIFCTKTGRTSCAGRARFLFTAVTLSGILVVPLKFLFGKARPDKLFDEHLYGFQWFVPPDAYGLHGFPSGHTTTAFAVATALALMWPRYTALFFTAALAVALSRIGVLYHYPSALFAGAALGTVTTLLLYLYPKTTFRSPPA